MEDSIDSSAFLSGKLFGAPYMPKDMTELLGYLQISGNYWLHNTGAWVDATYIEAYQFPLNYAALIRDVVVVYFVASKLSALLTYVRGYGIFTSLDHVFTWVKKALFSFFLSLPPVKKKVEGEMLAIIAKIEREVIQNDPKLLQFPTLPDVGYTTGDISDELDKLQHLKHTAWKDGRVSGAVYHGGDELIALQSEAYHKYAVANQLHPDVFPGVRKMESEVVAMVLDIFNAPKGGCGSSTSGGTESLLLTGLAARVYGKRKKGITRPEVIAPITVHAGIEKACFYFGMKLHKVDLDPVTFKVDINKVKRLINSNTVLLVGSAPNFPHGIIDDIEGLSALAVKHNIPLHVDACLGSFIVSFLEASKVHGDMTIPKFDFRLPGVTSISCDTHKYGFAPKGSSIIMYRHSELRECQYYILTDWTGGMYGSPTLAGSRPGALMVGCWATLIHIGKEGYTKSCRDIVQVSMKVKQAIRENPRLNKLEVLGDPIGSVVSFRVKDLAAKDLNIYELGDVLNEKGWHFSTLQNPGALHFAFTKLSIPIVDELISDLETAVEELSAKPSSEKSNSEVAALYGVAGSVKTVGVADRVIVAFLDTLYKT